MESLRGLSIYQGLNVKLGDSPLLYLLGIS